MRMTRAYNTPAARRGFTTVELMIVIVIIAIAVAIGAAAYSRMMGEAQKRTVGEHLRTVAGAIQLYYEQYRDYPPMRYADLGVTVTTWPARPTGAGQPDVVQSIEAAVYCLQYRSDAGKALDSLPRKVLRQGAVGPVGDTVTDAGQVRPLMVIYDPWGNPIQYVRPRELQVPPATPTDAANYPWSAGRLNNRVLLVSMGPDGVPGGQDRTVPSPAFEDPAGSGTWYPNPAALGTGDDTVLVVGRAP
jgi:prepilin-type N-terminal cleavage/methylation domain-containing protein